MPSTSKADGANLESVAQSSSGRTIVVIEDLKDLADVIALLLIGEGYKVHVATDGYTGLRLAIERNADLVLLDHLLPEMVGADVGRALRAHTHARKARIVMMSATPESDVRELFDGYDAFLKKPYEVDDLERALAGLRRLSV